RPAAVVRNRVGVVWIVVRTMRAGPTEAFQRGDDGSVVVELDGEFRSVWRFDEVVVELLNAHGWFSVDYCFRPLHPSGGKKPHAVSETDTVIRGSRDGTTSSSGGTCVAASCNESLSRQRDNWDNVARSTIALQG